MSLARRLVETDRAGEEPIPPSPPPSDGGAPEPGAGQAVTGPTEVSVDQLNAARLRDGSASLFCYATMVPAFQGIDAAAYQVYRDSLLADSGGPTDPIEVMIIEQLSLAHFGLGLLSCKAANAVKPEAVGIYAGAARLMGEFRRSALALQAYRHASRQLARDASRELVAIEESEAADDLPAEKCIGNEQGVTTEEPDAGQSIIPYPEPAAPGDPPRRSPEAGEDHAGGASQAPRRRAGAATLGAVHRSAQ